MILRQLLHQEELGSTTLVEDIAQLQAHLNNLVEQHQGHSLRVTWPLGPGHLPLSLAQISG